MWVRRFRSGGSVCVVLSLCFLVFAGQVLFDLLQPHEDVMGLVEEFAQDGRTDVFIFHHDVHERVFRLRT